MRFSLSIFDYTFTNYKNIFNGELLMSATAAIAYVGIYVGALAVAAGIMFTLRLVKLI